MSINIEINIEEKLWLAEGKGVARNLKSIINKIAPHTPLAPLLAQKIQIEISILLTNNKTIQKLNKTYRGKNKPTDVLSFPTFDTSKIKNGKLNKIKIENNFLALGDIVMALEIIKKEAAAQNKTFKNHLAHLLIHSLLHLLGFDHEKNSKDAKIMEQLEIKLLKELDIKNPYNI